MTKWDPHARPVADAEAGVNSEGTTITPIEAVVDAKSTRKLHAQAELSAQILEERQKRASEPIRMEGLKPLPPGLPRLPNGVIPGGPDSLGMVPSMRRAIPAPFRREAISIDHHGKTWAYIPADQVVPGDMVVDVGRVTEVASRVIYETVAGMKAATGTAVQLFNAESLTEVDPAEQLMVFRVHEES